MVLLPAMDPSPPAAAERRQSASSVASMLLNIDAPPRPCLAWFLSTPEAGHITGRSTRVRQNGRRERQPRRAGPRALRRESRDVVFDVDDPWCRVLGNKALQEVSLEIYKNFVTAFIGPLSGCGKSTFIRCFNRMNDLIPTASVEGTILYHGEDLYGPDVDPVEVRERIGMVFQKPNPFPKSIYDNVAFGPRVLR